MVKKTQISNAILNLFIKLQAVGETFWDFTYHPYKYVYKSLSEDMGLRESSIRSAITRLGQKGLLTKECDRQGEIIMKLTDAGKLSWIKYKLKSDEVRKLKDKYVLAIFDVPEAERTVRRALRSSLRDFGFVQWQKSVWATDRDIYTLLKKYFGLVGLKDYVIVLESAKISTE